MNRRSAKLTVIIIVAITLLSGCSTLVGSENTTTESTEILTATETPTKTVNETPTPTTTNNATETETPTPTKTETETSTTTQPDRDTITVKAAGGGTSNYKVYVPGTVELGPETEKTDSTHDDVSSYAQGITGEGAKDVYYTEGAQPGVVVNNGTATLEIYFNGELEKTVDPGANVENESENSVNNRDSSTESSETHYIEVESVSVGSSDYTLSSKDEIELGDKTDPNDYLTTNSSNMAIGHVGDNDEVDSYIFHNNYFELNNQGHSALEIRIDGERIGMTDGSGYVDTNSYQPHLNPEFDNNETNISSTTSFNYLSLANSSD